MEINRPPFGIMASIFEHIYGNGKLEWVADTIGGEVKNNIDNKTFRNTCAIRMSFCLNYSGVLIPADPWPTSSGKDKLFYIYRLHTLKEFLIFKFGKPDKVIGAPQAADFNGMKGILIFEEWFPHSQATGHATLWDGNKCSDSDYFGTATKGKLWLLPSQPWRLEKSKGTRVWVSQ